MMRNRPFVASVHYGLIAQPSAVNIFCSVGNFVGPQPILFPGSRHFAGSPASGGERGHAVTGQLPGGGRSTENAQRDGQSGSADLGARRAPSPRHRQPAADSGPDRPGRSPSWNDG